MDGTNVATPRPTRSQKSIVIADDTDIESDGNVELYKTPIALQKRKKTAPVSRRGIESSKLGNEESVSESEINLNLKGKKRNGPHSSTKVRRLLLKRI